MALSKSDCYLLLAEIEKKGTDTKEILNKLIVEGSPSIEVVRFINDHRQLDLYDFFVKIRKSYNNKKSQLYINIMKETDDPLKVLTTLSAMLTQILLFAEKAQDRQMFLRHSRAEEITIVLNNYIKTYDITQCQKLIHLIRADIKTLEYVNGRDVK